MFSGLVWISMHPTSGRARSTMRGGSGVFNQPLDSWRTDSVVDMSGMFREATVFNQPLTSWRTGSVVDMSGMFGDPRYYRPGTEFNQDIDNWQVDSVTDMSNMFAKNAINQPLDSWRPD